MYQYAFGAKSLQLLVSLRFFNPRDDAYCPKKTMDFFEVTGGGMLSFRNVSMGGTRSPELVEGNAEGAKLPRGYVAEKTSPGALSPSSLDK